MKEEKTKKKKFLYYLVLAISVCLLTAATVLTVYFVTDDKAGSLNTDPPGQVVTPPDNTGDDDKKDPDDKPTLGEVEKFCDPVAYTNASVYNAIYTNTYHMSAHHEGVDFAADEGAQVVAIADGTVTSISLNARTGNIITVDHGDGLIAKYRYVEPVSTLKNGAKVTKGQCFATVAAPYGPEKQDGTHLHLELHVKGKNVDPASYLDIQYQEK